jgi:hypothetical protein
VNPFAGGRHLNPEPGKVFLQRILHAPVKQLVAGFSYLLLDNPLKRSTIQLLVFHKRLRQATELLEMLT